MKKRSQKPRNKDGIVTRIPQPIAPNSTYVRLTWIDTVSSMNYAGYTYVWKRYQVNGAYDIDPLIGGTAMAGFAEWAAFYRRYRVLKSKFTARCANFDSNTFVQGVLLPLNLDPGATPSLTTLQTWAMQPYAKTFMLSAKGGMDRANVSLTTDLIKFAGLKGVAYDDTFASLCTTVPANGVYVGVGFIALGGPTFTLGIATAFTCELDIEFYERAELAV